MITNKLVIICASYPYGKTETFLENEINYLSKYFDIEVFPIKKYKNSDQVRENIPSNLTYHEPIVSRNIITRLYKGLFNTSPLLIYFGELLRMIKIGAFKKCFPQYFINMLSYRTLFSNSNFREHLNNENDLIYFYWGNSPAGFLKTKCRIFVRVHGGEVDLERNHGFIPEFVFSKNIIYLPISEKVKFLLERRDLQVCLNRLGTFDHGVNRSISSSNLIRIVSCSNIIPLKRLNIIIEALSQINSLQIEWNHFGDGPLKDSIERMAQELLPENINVIFHGRISNLELMTFYKSNYVDLFINVSQFEGVPVSIMEALSFGIPCFATNAGASSEVVNPNIGKLVEIDFDIQELIYFIENIRHNIFLRENCRNFWEQNYKADTNYNKLFGIFSMNSYNKNLFKLL